MTTLKARFSLPSRDEKLAEEKGVELNKMGFEVTGIGTRGMTIQGTPEQFEKAFGGKVKVDEKGASFESMPTIPESLGCHEATVYFPTKPEFCQSTLPNGER